LVLYYLGSLQIAGQPAYTLLLKIDSDEVLLVRYALPQKS